MPVKAKARAVVRGDQEAALGAFRRDSPTGTLIGQHLACQAAAGYKWELHSGDIENAYFQGVGMGDRSVFIVPPRKGLKGVDDGCLV